MEIFKKGTAFRAFFKRPQKHGGHLVLCYIGLYTILQLQLVCARHHDLGKLIGSNNNNNNNNFNDNELNNLQPEQQQQHQQSVNAQIIHNQHDDEQPILKQPPILDQKITQQSPSEIDGPNGAVLSKDDGKYLWCFSSHLFFTIIGRPSVWTLFSFRKHPPCLFLSSHFECLVAIKDDAALSLFNYRHNLSMRWKFRQQIPQMKNLKFRPWFVVLLLLFRCPNHPRLNKSIYVN